MPRNNLLFRSCLATITVGLLACTTPSADWWTFQRDARRTGYVRGGMGRNPQLFWQVPLVSGTTSLTPPVWGAIGSTFRIFIGSGYGDGRLFALHPYTGATLWTFSVAPNSGIFGAPAAADSTVYFATRGNTPHVYAVRQATGALVWQTPLTGTGSNASVVASHGMVIVNTDAHQVHAFNRYTGALLWTANTSPGATSQESSPSVAYNRVYVGSDDGLFAFNITNGAQIWKYNLTGTPGFSSAVIDTMSPGLVFIGANDQKLHAVNAATGANVWTYNAASATMAFNSAAIADGRVLIIDYDTVKALDRNNGSVLWSRAMPAIPRHSPAVAGSMVFVHDNSNVHGLSGFTGAPAWQRPIPGNGTANALGNAMGIALEILLVPNKGQLHAFR